MKKLIDIKTVAGVTAFLILFFVGGCGYQPVARYTKSIFNSPVYVDVILSGVEPRNGVFLKDEIMRMLMTRFHVSVTKKAKNSKTEIVVPKYHFEYSALTYDDNGYVTRYRISASILFRLVSEKGSLEKKIVTSEDVSIQGSSLTSSAAREAGIRASIRKSLDKFTAYVAQKGLM